MHVMFLIPSLTGGGAEFVASTWSKQLASRGHSVDVYCTESSSHDSRNLPGVNVHYLDGGIVRQIKYVHKLIYKPADSDSVLVCMMPYWNILGLLAKMLGVARAGGDRGRVSPVVISSRNVERPLLSRLGGRVLQRVASRVLYRYCDAAVAISHPVEVELVSAFGVSPSKIYVVRNPALAKFGDTLIGSSAVAARVSDQRIDIVVPARLVPQKRPTLALQVAAHLAERQFEVRVVFCGSGALERTVVEAAAEMNVSVEMRGWRDRWYEGLSANAVVLLPSYVEGFGNVLVEAAAAGIPSVASSRAMGVADAIVPGITGILVPGDNEYWFADGILQALECSPLIATSWLDQHRAEVSTASLTRVLREVLRLRTDSES